MHSALLNVVLPPMLGVSAAAAAEAAPGSVLAGVTESHMSKLLRDDVYSRLLEVGAWLCVGFVCVGSQACMAKLLRDGVCSRLLEVGALTDCVHHMCGILVAPLSNTQGKAAHKSAGGLLTVPDEHPTRTNQVVLAVAPAPLWTEFHARFLKGRLMPLTSHHAANFVVQAALAGAQGKQQVGGGCGGLLRGFADAAAMAACRIRVAAATLVGAQGKQHQYIAVLLGQLWTCLRLLLLPGAGCTLVQFHTYTHTRTQVSVIFEELEGFLAPLLLKRRSGILAALAAACGREGVCQREVCAAIARALGSLPQWQGREGEGVAEAGVLKINHAGP